MCISLDACVCMCASVCQLALTVTAKFRSRVRLSRNVELISNRSWSRGFSGGARNDLLGTTLWALLVLNNRILVPPVALDGQDNSVV